MGREIVRPLKKIELYKFEPSLTKPVDNPKKYGNRRPMGENRLKTFVFCLQDSGAI
jgi:hypothetical protein